MSRLSFLLAFVLLFTATLLAQDSNPTATVNNEISSITSSVANGRYSRTGAIQYLDLNNGEEQTINVSLTANQLYQFWGACDADCGDIDFVLSDVYGNEIDSDALEDSRPVVRPEAGMAGTYRLTVKMYDCSYNPCKVGIATYVAPNGNSASNTPNGIVSTPAPSSNDGSPGAVVDVQLDVISSSMNSQGLYARSSTNYLWLDDNETEVVTLNLNANRTYRIWGVCDGDCEDMDLELVDLYGNQIAVDEASDAQPVLSPNLRGSGEYQLRVKMYDCSVEPCKVGVQVYSN